MSRLLALIVIAAPAACWRSAPGELAQSAPATSAHSAPQVEGTGMPLTPAVLLETIETSYLGGLRRCYTARLKRDGRARGRVVVTFTVDGRGRLSDGRARGVGKQIGKQIEACVERAMTRWAFPPARNADGGPTETTFRLALELTAS